MEKKSTIPVRESKKRVRESKNGSNIDITKHFSFLRLNSRDKVCILNWNLGKESLYVFMRDIKSIRTKISLYEKLSS